MKLCTNNRLSGAFSQKDVVWAALEKIGHKHKNRSAIAPNSVHEVNLHLSGTVNGEPFEQDLYSIVSVGCDQQKATSATPDLPKLIAVILGKLNRATREKLLAEIPTEFAHNDGEMPNCSQAIVAQTDLMLKKLRSEKQIRVKGSVRCQTKM